MTKVIEVNISKLGDMIIDHQCRVCEYLSWRDFKKQFIFNKDLPRKEPISCIGLPGAAISSFANVTKLKHDENKLYCEYNIGANSCVYLAERIDIYE